MDLRVLVAHAGQMAVGHDREERLAFAVHAFAHGAEDLAVRPVAQARLRIGSDVLAGSVPGKPIFASQMNPPTPTRSGLNGSAYWYVRSEWQSMQMVTWCTRYWPRAIRAGVDSTFSATGARCAGFFSDSHETPMATSATTTSKTIPTTFKKVFMCVPSDPIWSRILRERSGRRTC